VQPAAQLGLERDLGILAPAVLQFLRPHVCSETVVVTAVIWFGAGSDG